MADESLKNKIKQEARPLTAGDMPANFPFPLVDFLLSLDLSSQAVVDQVNAASSGAYDAQVSSESNAESIEQTSITLDLHDKRIFTVEQVSSQNAASIAQIQREISDNASELGELKERVDFIESDYVSKSEVAPQEIASPFGVVDSYSVNGVVVIKARNTGWTAAGGNVPANKGVWNPNTIAPASTAYTKAEIDVIIASLNAANARVKALEAAMRYHGLIG